MYKGAFLKDEVPSLISAWKTSALRVVRAEARRFLLGDELGKRYETRQLKRRHKER